MATPYARLGLQEDATVEEIRAARHNLAKEHHPDLHKGSLEKEAILKQINAAADLLLNSERRAKLDAHLRTLRMEQARAKLNAANAAFAAAKASQPEKAAPPPKPPASTEPLSAPHSFFELAARLTKRQGWTDPSTAIALGVGIFADLMISRNAQPSRSTPTRSPRGPGLGTRDREGPLCKRTTTEGWPCRNLALPGNYGCCGVHRRLPHQ